MRTFEFSARGIGPVRHVRRGLELVHPFFRRLLKIHGLQNFVAFVKKHHQRRPVHGAGAEADPCFGGA